MIRASFVATAILVLAAAPALADEPVPAPPPAGPSPLPVPYPGDPQPPPPECTNRFCIPKPGAGQGGVAEHKHIGNVKYSDYAKAAATDTLEVQVQNVAWGAIKDAGTVYSADPMEGGQVTARTYQPGKPTFGNVKLDGVASDPEEGGQVSAAEASKPKISDMQVTKVKDVASSNLSSARMTTAEPGKLEVPNMIAEPMARGTATFKTLAGLCATGKHLVKVRITTREGGSYTLHDAIVTNVVAAGDGMDEVSLTYASLGD
jgi:hypothetical protein